MLTLLAVSTRFVRSQLLDSEHYVATVAPLASDPAVQGQIADSVTDAIVGRLDLNALVANTLSELSEITPAQRPRADAALAKLAPLLAGQAETFIRSTVNQFVASGQFADLWAAANRAAHQSLVAAVTGQGQREAVRIGDDGTVAIGLGPIIDAVKVRLAQRGFGFADQIPAINKEFVVFSSPQLARTQSLVRTLDKVATILPWLVLAAAAGAIAVSGTGRRWRTVSLVGLAVVIAMLLLALGILIGRAVYLGEVPVEIISLDAARVVFDTTIHPLRVALRAVAVVGLVAMVVGFLGERSRSPRGGWPTDRIAVVLVAAAVVMFWPYPTGMVVVWTATLACLTLVGIELLIQPTRFRVLDQQ
ncbi:hypothetical protein GOEFS_096_01040 [Gordonia effusa NBRC 100432]|uniref:Integral membrane protein n=1 Tax=Gordonia effusa NBRC 100432 TaxID=1077974 RepID=H0R4C6_9ACTN|nr:hypothetical protein GOEFS_096_01040 [Gordonia effusa NBRC 100432]